MRHALREYFLAALVAFEDLDAADALELLAKAPDPATAARLTITQISAALTHARRRNVAEKAELNASPGARAHYDQLKARGTEHNAALRQLADRLVGILHGYLKTRTCDDEATAWAHLVERLQLDIQAPGPSDSTHRATEHQPGHQPDADQCSTSIEVPGAEGRC